MPKYPLRWEEPWVGGYLRGRYSGPVRGGKWRSDSGHQGPISHEKEEVREDSEQGTVSIEAMARLRLESGTQWTNGQYCSQVVPLFISLLDSLLSRGLSTSTCISQPCSHCTSSIPTFTCPGRQQSWGPSGRAPPGWPVLPEGQKAFQCFGLCLAYLIIGILDIKIRHQPVGKVLITVGHGVAADIAPAPQARAEVLEVGSVGMSLPCL